MKKLLLPLLVLAACNTAMEGRTAPELQAGDWLDGQAPAGEWTVLTFFAPG